MIRRINLYGGPGIGKTSLALWLTSELKAKRINCDYVDEYIKTWAYEKRTVRHWDQPFIFANQLHKEFNLLASGVDVIVSDSPLLLQIAYLKRSDSKVLEEILSQQAKFENDFPSLHLFLEREVAYNELGRWENYDQALDMDKLIKETLDLHVSWLPIKISEQNKVLENVLAALERKS